METLRRNYSEGEQAAWEKGVAEAADWRLKSEVGAGGAERVKALEKEIAHLEDERDAARRASAWQEHDEIGKRITRLKAEREAILKPAEQPAAVEKPAVVERPAVVEKPVEKPEEAPAEKPEEAPRPKTVAERRADHAQKEAEWQANYDKLMAQRAAITAEGEQIDEDAVKEDTEAAQKMITEMLGVAEGKALNKANIEMAEQRKGSDKKYWEDEKRKWEDERKYLAEIVERQKRTIALPTMDLLQDELRRNNAAPSIEMKQLTHAEAKIAEVEAEIKRYEAELELLARVKERVGGAAAPEPEENPEGEKGGKKGPEGAPEPAGKPVEKPVEKDPEAEPEPKEEEVKIPEGLDVDKLTLEELMRLSTLPEAESGLNRATYDHLYKLIKGRKAAPAPEPAAAAPDPAAEKKPEAEKVEFPEGWDLDHLNFFEIMEAKGKGLINMPTFQELIRMEQEQREARDKAFDEAMAAGGRRPEGAPEADPAAAAPDPESDDSSSEGEPDPESREGKEKRAKKGKGKKKLRGGKRRTNAAVAAVISMLGLGTTMAVSTAYAVGPEDLAGADASEVGKSNTPGTVETGDGGYRPEFSAGTNTGEQQQDTTGEGLTYKQENDKYAAELTEAFLNGDLEEPEEYIFAYALGVEQTHKGMFANNAGTDFNARKVADQAEVRLDYYGEVTSGEEMTQERQAEIKARFVLQCARQTESLTQAFMSIQPTIKNELATRWPGMEKATVLQLEEAIENDPDLREFCLRRVVDTVYDADLSVTETRAGMSMAYITGEQTAGKKEGGEALNLDVDDLHTRVHTLTEKDAGKPLIQLQRWDDKARTMRTLYFDPVCGNLMVPAEEAKSVPQIVPTKQETKQETEEEDTGDPEGDTKKDEDEDKDKDKDKDEDKDKDPGDETPKDEEKDKDPTPPGPGPSDDEKKTVPKDADTAVERAGDGAVPLRQERDLTDEPEADDKHPFDDQTGTYRQSGEDVAASSGFKVTGQPEMTGSQGGEERGDGSGDAAAAAAPAAESGATGARTEVITDAGAAAAAEETVASGSTPGIVPEASSVATGETSGDAASASGHGTIQERVNEGAPMVDEAGNPITGMQGL